MNNTTKLTLLALLLAAALTGCRDPENPGGNETEAEITVTTYAPTEVTDTTALCGGHVTVTGTAQIEELGLCWGTEHDPVATGCHLPTSATDEPFTCTLTGLQPETQYHVRAYALHESEYHYGEDLCFTTLAAGNGGGEEPEGFTSGLFSVSDTLKVRFSPGNLQYQASTNTWRFAESQKDYIGEDNAKLSETYDGWIDLFGWGTSGYNHGARAYQPWSTSTHYSDYYAYGFERANLHDHSGQADWGYNAISNGGNTENSGWRTLRKTEWAYLTEERATPTGIRFANACVEGTNGMLLFPDDWDGSYTFSDSDNSTAPFGSNIIGAEAWSGIEAKGVVFLPAAGERVSGAETGYVQTVGMYWTSTAYSSDFAYMMYFMNYNEHRSIDVYDRNNGFSVRLVKNVTGE